MYRTRSGFGCLLLAAGLSACDTTSAPLPSASVPAGALRSLVLSDPELIAALPGHTLDGQFARIGALVPGFGGSYIESDQFVIVLTNMAGKDSAISTIRTRIPEYITRRYPLVVRQGEYDFLQLARWRMSIDHSVTFPGIRMTDVNERRNRIVIGYTDPDAIAKLNAAIIALAIPFDAIVLEHYRPVSYGVARAPMLADTLGDVIRPVVGGSRIIGWGACTLGATVLRLLSSDTLPYFVTNSHCTVKRDSVDGTIFAQPTVGHDIGIEWLDPIPTASPSCPANYVCRYADITAIAYYDSITPAFGYLARTVSRGSTSTEIDVQNPTIQITYEVGFPLYTGQVLDKMGATSGWTYGESTHSCVNEIIYGAGKMLMCQEQADIFSTSGDSGSPVFEYQQDGSAHIYGFLWGNTVTIAGDTLSIFSALSEVASDFSQHNVFFKYR